MQRRRRIRLIMGHGFKSGCFVMTQRRNFCTMIPICCCTLQNKGIFHPALNLIRVQKCFPTLLLLLFYRVRRPLENLSPPPVQPDRLIDGQTDRQTDGNSGGGSGGNISSRSTWLRSRTVSNEMRETRRRRAANVRARRRERQRSDDFDESP
jgi:hypothetical protein